MNTKEPRKNRFHLTLRDLFWLVFVAALALGWWRDRGALAIKNSELATKNSQLRWQLVSGTKVRGN
jgi:hypothetical protein